MWIDAHDGHVAMSWGHERQGENVQIESIATNNGASPYCVSPGCMSSPNLSSVSVIGSAYLLRSPYNTKGSCFHVQETVQGIQSRLDPYDIHLSDQPALQTSVRKPSSFRRQIGFSSFVIPEAPTTISILLFLEEDGTLTCRLFDARTHGGASSIGSDDKVGIRSDTQGITDIHPKDLLSRHINFTTAIDVEPVMDDAVPDDMDVDEEKDDFEWSPEEDNEDDSPYQCIRTRDLWKSE